MFFNTLRIGWNIYINDYQWDYVESWLQVKGGFSGAWQHFITSTISTRYQNWIRVVWFFCCSCTANLMCRMCNVMAQLGIIWLFLVAESEYRQFVCKNYSLRCRTQMATVRVSVCQTNNLLLQSEIFYLLGNFLPTFHSAIF